ncbi:MULTISPECIES: hypothetical protein [unclassified Sinorhizobium]|uniref:hypothetical protein n=1 Tax=unclassified Sinorhizobium TaxID=2613772 RepID=UPI003525C665
MRNLIFAAAFLLPSAALAVQAVEVNARSYTCNQIAQIIRQSKAVFVRIGIGGRSFRYPPARCNPGDKRVTTSFRDATGQLCVLDYACDYDPESIYNRID